MVPVPQHSPNWEPTDNLKDGAQDQVTGVTNKVAELQRQNKTLTAELAQTKRELKKEKAAHTKLKNQVKAAKFNQVMKKGNWEMWLDNVQHGLYAQEHYFEAIRERLENQEKEIEELKEIIGE